MMLPEVTVSVLLSGNNFTVDFENEFRVFTAYARFFGNCVSILLFSFYIYEEIKKIKVVILFYLYLHIKFWERNIFG